MARTKKHKLTGAKAVSKLCSNNNSCSYCRSNRLYKNLKKNTKTSQPAGFFTPKIFFTK